MHVNRSALQRPIVAALVTTLALAGVARADTPNDPYFANQWHLRNTGQFGGTAGNDINVAAWWNFAGNTHLGAGVNIGIVDDGLEWAHPDLQANYKSALSYDFNYGDSDPTPDKTADNHGTSVAGVAAGAGNNGVGMTGVAPRAGLAGIRLISAGASDATEAAALTHKFNGATAADTIQIYSNSWGPADDGETLEGPGAAVKAAFANATTNGRQGRGSIYTWAAGNGGDADNSNFDGYANSRYVIAVAASDYKGVRSYYSERGSNLFVNAPSSGSTSNSGIYTTDRTGAAGYNTSSGSGDGDAFGDLNYTSTFGGTSSATPVVSGVVALMLEANPNLGWRDVKHILARTSTINDPTNSSWTTNAAGFKHSELYGFGRVNATAAATMAQTWTNVGPELTATASKTLGTPLSIPDGSGTSGTTPGAIVTDSILVTAQLVLETIEVTLNVSHTWRGDLGITLTSPGGTVSNLATPRAGDSADNLVWTFTTVRDWGELSAGTWTLGLRDYYGGDTGRLNSWSLALYGTAVPEPMAVVTLAASALLFVRRRRA